MPLGKMFALAFMAGMFISFAGVASSVAATTVENASLGKLIAALVFPAGLAMVILNNSELFTGNNLLIISVLDKRIKFIQCLKLDSSIYWKFCWFYFCYRWLCIRS